MTNKLVEEAPYHPGYEDVGFKVGDFRNVDTPKPTAWIREDGVIAFHPKTEVDSEGFKWFPLYLHPAKQLTDEEINTEMLAYLNSKTMGLEDFAKAILRKAQEK